MVMTHYVFLDKLSRMCKVDKTIIKSFVGVIIGIIVGIVLGAFLLLYFFPNV
jgi:hypothetical protein